jgi:MFS family permease
MKTNIWQLPISNLFFWLAVYLFLPILPIHFGALGMSGQDIGLIIGSFSLGSVLMRPIFGMLIDRYGGYWFLKGGVLLSLTSIAAYLLSYAMPQSIIFFRFLHGIGSASYSAAAVTLVTLTSKADEMKNSLGLYTLCSMIGLSIATSSAVFIYQWGMWMAIIITAIIATAVILIIVPHDLSQQIVVSSNKKGNVQRVIKNCGVYIPFLCLLMIYSCYGCIITFLPLFINEITGISMKIFYISYATSVVLSRLYIKKICTILNERYWPIILLLLFAATMILPLFSQQKYILVLAGLGVGISTGLSTPILTGIVAQYTLPEERGTALSVFSTSIDLGMVIGTLFIGYVINLWGYAYGFIIMAVSSVVTSGYYGYVFLKKHENSKLNQRSI